MFVWMVDIDFKHCAPFSLTYVSDKLNPFEVDLTVKAYWDAAE